MRDIESDGGIEWKERNSLCVEIKALLLSSSKACDCCFTINTRNNRPTSGTYLIRPFVGFGWIYGYQIDAWIHFCRHTMLYCKILFHNNGQEKVDSAAQCQPLHPSTVSLLSQLYWQWPPVCKRPFSMRLLKHSVQKSKLIKISILRGDSTNKDWVDLMENHCLINTFL